MACLQCPDEGINCDNRHAIEVLRGYYLQPDEHLTTLEGRVWRCAQEAACVGGVFTNRTNRTTCADGHDGPLCGTCLPGFYRSQRMCEPCAGSMAEDRMRIGTSETVAVLVFAASIMIALVGLFLVKAGQKDAARLRQKRGRYALRGLSRRYSTARVKGLRGRIEELRRFTTLASQKLVTSSTLCKILLGFCQCIAVVRKFHLVRWPDLFDTFLNTVQKATLEIFDLVPAECTIGDRLGFHLELLAALLTPIGLVSFLLLYAKLLAPFANREGGKRTLSDWPQVWDCIVWILLIQYPTLSRKTLLVFDCVQFEDSKLLREDPVLVCSDGGWRVWEVLAGAGVLLYGIGLPALAWAAARRLAQGNVARRRLVQVLTRCYRDPCWYMESVDLLRKFLMTGVITLVSPQSKVQLWFGLVVSLTFLMLHMRLEPYRDPLCNTVQLAVHVQLVLTYTTSLLFHVESFSEIGSSAETRDDGLGALLILLNSLAFVLITAMAIRGAHRVTAEMKQAHLEWREGGGTVQLVPPNAPGGYHLFLSHVWRYAQDTAGTLKSTLRSLVPSCVTFLDVDDLEDISKLEECIEASNVVLIIVTDRYLSSANCRRELVAALKAKKPLILLCESDPDKGATNPAKLRAEVHNLERSGVSAEDLRAAKRLVVMLEEANVNLELPSVVQWHRERELKGAVFKLIAAHVSRTQRAKEAIKIAHIRDVQVSGEKVPEAPEWGQLFMCRRYHRLKTRHHTSLQDELKARLGELGGFITDETEGERDPSVPALLLLAPQVFEDPELVREIEEMITPSHHRARAAAPSAKARKLLGLSELPPTPPTEVDAAAAGHSPAPPTFIPLYSVEKPFAYYMQKCDEHAPHLKELGLFSHLFNKWPAERVLQREVVLQKLLPHMQPVSMERGACAKPSSSMGMLIRIEQQKQASMAERSRRVRRKQAMTPPKQLEPARLPRPGQFGGQAMTPPKQLEPARLPRPGQFGGEASMVVSTHVDAGARAEAASAGPAGAATFDGGASTLLQTCGEEPSWSSHLAGQVSSFAERLSTWRRRRPLGETSTSIREESTWRRRRPQMSLDETSTSIREESTWRRSPPGSSRSPTVLAETSLNKQVLSI
jgi:hypothetical protein